MQNKSGNAGKYRLGQQNGFIVLFLKYMEVSAQTLGLKYKTCFLLSSSFL